MTDRPLRVLHVINGLGTGGSERSLRELVPGLATRGIESAIACLHHRERGVEAELADEVPITWLEGRRTAQLRQARSLISAYQPQIVHTTLFDSDVLGRLASWRRPVRVVTSLVNTPYVAARLDDPGVRAGRLRAVQLIDGVTARHLTDQFIALSPAVRSHCIEALRLRPERVAVVQRGRDTERLGEPGPDRRARVRAAMGLTDEQPVLLSVGRQEHQKGQEHLVRSLPALVDRDPSTRLLVAGRKGNATDHLERLTRSLGLEAHVWWLGHREDVPDLMSAADVFCLPSLYEGQAGVLIESMALGLPIVASDLPAVAETAPAGEAAVLVPPADVPSLTRALISVLADPQLAARLGCEGRRRFASTYTLEAMVDGTAQVYRSLVGP